MSTDHRAMPSDSQQLLATLGAFSTLEQLRLAIARHRGEPLHVHRSRTLTGAYRSAVVIEASDGVHLVVPVANGCEPLLLEVRALAHLAFGHQASVQGGRLVGPYTPEQEQAADDLAQHFMAHLASTPR